MKFLDSIWQQEVSVRSKRRIIAFTYHALIAAIGFTGIIVGQALSSSCLIRASATVLIADILTFRVIPITLLIEEKLIPEAVCYGCGAMIDLTGLYKCGCGFLPHEERHIFTPCPMCGKTFSWITCPECETSIPI
jgi:hypothetical protein